MKKTKPLLLSLITILSLSLAACGSDGDDFDRSLLGRWLFQSQTIKITTNNPQADTLLKEYFDDLNLAERNDSIYYFDQKDHYKIYANTIDTIPQLKGTYVLNDNNLALSAHNFNYHIKFPTLKILILEKDDTKLVDSLYIDILTNAGFPSPQNVIIKEAISSIHLNKLPEINKNK